MQRAALYTADPWDSALTEIRVRRPAAHANVEILQGYHNGNIDQALVDQADLIIIQRDFPRFPDSIQVVHNARRLGKPVIYETDDWLFDVPEWNIQHAAYKNYLSGMLWTLTQADRVVTCNPLLAQKLSIFNSDVHIFDNYLVDELWPLRPPITGQDGPLKIGFMGSTTHREDLRELAPILITILEKFADRVNLIFWGCRPPDELTGHPRVIWNEIHYQSYVEFSDYFSKQACDIFIAPLSHNEFNRAKSPLKFLEYSSLGIPGVYSKIDPYEGIIQDGKNGLLAATPQEWLEKIEALILSPELRLDLATAAQQVVTRDWLLSGHHTLWSSAMEGPWGDPAYLPQNQQILGHITEKTQRQIWEMESTISSLSQEVIDLSNHLNAVLSSNTWKLARKFQKLIDLVRPRR